jgi:opacity protein-like surface antigen
MSKNSLMVVMLMLFVVISNAFSGEDLKQNITLKYGFDDLEKCVRDGMCDADETNSFYLSYGLNPSYFYKSFSSNVKTEIEVGYKSDYKYVNEPYKTSLKVITALINYNYESNLSNNVKSYIGIGVGGASINGKDSDDGNIVSKTTSKHAFLYGFNAGAIFDINKSFNINIGYRYLMSSRFNFAFVEYDSTISHKPSDLKSNEFSIGLSYNF